MNVTSASADTGAKSLTTSNESLGKRLGLTTWLAAIIATV
jgi:hypothetical protein